MKRREEKRRNEVDSWAVLSGDKLIDDLHALFGSCSKLDCMFCAYRRVFMNTVVLLYLMSYDICFTGYLIPCSQ